jgi:hypothetical protein
MSTRPKAIWVACLVLWCAGCPKEPQSCLAYACINSARLHGSMPMPAATRRLDVELCRETTCESGSIDVSALEADGAQCALWGEDRQVCAQTSDDPESVSIEAEWRTPVVEKLPDDAQHKLRIVDSDTGQVLLDVTRTAKFSVTRQDACHLCVGADMPF